MDTSIATRLEKIDYVDLMLLIKVGIFKTKSDAARYLISNQLRCLRERASELFELMTLIEKFDALYLESPRRAKVILRRIDEIKGLLPYELVYAIERQSELLEIARANP